MRSSFRLSASCPAGVSQPSRPLRRCWSVAARPSPMQPLQLDRSQACLAAAARPSNHLGNDSSGPQAASGSPGSNGNGSHGRDGNDSDPVTASSVAAAVSPSPQASSSVSAGDDAGAAQQSEQSDSDAQCLRDEVEELRQLLLQQNRVIEQQQEAIRLMEVHLGGQRPQQHHASAAPAAPPLRAASPALPTQGPELQEHGSRLHQHHQSSANELVPKQLEPLPRLAERYGMGENSLGIVEASIGDRRLLGCYDARYHSTHSGATPRDFRLLPRRIVLVRHAQSEGNVDAFQYSYVPDPKVPLTARGWEQALDAGEKLKSIMDADGAPYKLFFYTSPYLRSKQTYEGLIQAFKPHQLIGVQEEVQLREQDFGNFQDTEGKKREKAERLRFGRFFYRFPNGESGADVYDRMTIFEDHLVRDINAGRYGYDSTLVLVTHGLAARIFLMRWFHWTVDQFMNVFNPPNADPIVMERITSEHESRQGGPASWIHTKALYRLTDDSMDKLVGCTEDMCSTSWLPRGIDSPREYSSH